MKINSEKVSFINEDLNKNTNVELVNKINDLSEKINHISLNRSQYHRRESRSPYRRNYERRGDITCFRCGTRGHIRVQCHASQKTIAQFNKRNNSRRRYYRRDSYNRSRDRYYKSGDRRSRDNSYSRRDNRSDRRERSNSSYRERDRSCSRNRDNNKDNYRERRDNR